MIHYGKFVAWWARPALNKKKRMTEDHIKEPHTAMFIGQTGCGKTYLVLELIEE